MANTVRRAGVTRPRPVVENIVPASDWTEDSSSRYLLIDLPGFQKDQMKIQIFNTGLIKVTGERPVNENKHIRFEQDFEVPEYSDADGITAKFEGEILYINVPKRKVEEKKEPQPHKVEEKKEPETHEAEENKEPEPAGVKDQIVDGATKDQNMCEIPKDREDKKEVDYINGNSTVRKLKKEEGSRRTTPVSFTDETAKTSEGEPSYLGRVMEMLRRNKGTVVTTLLAVSLGIFISRTFKTNKE